MNRLSRQTSPYLRQHQDNPVHWWAWGDEAFAAARTQNKPILLSVGYAACHWCHVMAHESFEDSGTAELMNEGFINIKVDREERPDVDAVYQKALAVMGESGGWPLTMFLTPQGQPFWGGTYFPPAPRYGRPSFQQVLTQLAKVWREDRSKIDEQATSLHGAIAHRPAEALRDGLSFELINDAARHLLDYMDHENGGLSGAPKFPMPFVWEFVWRAYKRTNDAGLKSAVVTTLDRICQGGICDHLGGGFARYSTDDRWLAPHFEKMLYDNALLIGLMALVWQETGSPLYAQRTAETIAWLEREMLGESGAYTSALDADSEGEEGRFYVWSETEISALLGDAAALFKDAYDIAPGGNWEGKTILNRLSEPSFNTGEDDKLAPMRAKLLAHRASRVRPGRDHKILADWNGLAVESLARAALIFSNPDWLAIARRIYTAVSTTMTWQDGPGRTRLGHSFCDGVLQQVDVLDDYAHMANAALALHGATGNESYIASAKKWVAVANDVFWDPAGGYFFTPADRNDLIVRTKTAHDSAQPSGNGAMVLALARLHALTGEDDYRARADTVCQTFAAEAFKAFPHAVTVLNGYDLLANPLGVVITGAHRDALAKAVWSVSEPNLVLSVVDDANSLPPLHPAYGKKALAGRATAYVCRGPVCSAPVTEAEALIATLQRS
jgi:uncharacterized protein